jgi:molybdate transport system substrate-binding protein
MGSGVKTGWRLGTVFTAAAIFMGLAHAGDVSVAVATNFTAPMQKIATVFAQDTGHTARLSFGATSKLYAQIRNGAPFQLLLAADEATPARLEQEGLALAGSRFTYAVGRLVLWSKRPGLVDDKGDVLRQGTFAHLAVADPRLAPYGAAAMQTLEHMGLLSRLQPRMVQGESIAQTYQFVATGNAELGFVAQSQVMPAGRLTQGSAWLVPAHLHAPIRQDALVLARGKDHPAALALAAFLQGDKARAIIRSFGYEQ